MSVWPQLADLLRATGDDDRARETYERGIAILEGVLGPEHPDLAHGQYKLAILHADTGAIALSGEMALPGRPHHPRASSPHRQHTARAGSSAVQLPEFAETAPAPGPDVGGRREGHQSWS